MSVVKSKHFTVNDGELNEGGLVGDFDLVSSKPKSVDWTKNLTLKDDIDMNANTLTGLEPSVDDWLSSSLREVLDLEVEKDTLGKEQIEYTGNLSQEEIQKREQSEEVIKY